MSHYTRHCSLSCFVDIVGILQHKAADLVLGVRTKRNCKATNQGKEGCGTVSAFSCVWFSCSSLDLWAGALSLSQIKCCLCAYDASCVQVTVCTGHYFLVRSVLSECGWDFLTVTREGIMLLCGQQLNIMHYCNMIF